MKVKARIMILLTTLKRLKKNMLMREHPLYSDF